jgi:hypothetical protein
MLLVHHEEAQIFEGHVGRQEPVRAYHDVDFAGSHSGQHRLLLLGGPKARQYLDLDRKIGQPLEEGPSMLIGENRGRHENRHLLPALHRFERSPHGDLGLAIADVAD